MNSASDGMLIAFSFAAMLWLGGLVCAIGAVAHRKPGVPWSKCYWRGYPHRREDLTPAGWELHRASWLFGASFIVVLVMTLVWTTLMSTR